MGNASRVTIIMIMMISTAAAADLSGPARAIDGDTIRIGATSVRIWGIAAPERYEPGGHYAERAMSIIVARGPVTCQDTRRRSQGRVVGRCYVDGKDIAEIMVSHGFARDCRAYSGGLYAGFETDEARRLPLPAYCAR